VVKDLEVSAVVEDTATWTGEHAPVGPWRVILKVLAEEHDELRMDGHWPRFAARPVLQFAALARGAAVGPPGTAARLGAGQDQFAPAEVGQASDVSGT
jgi:hypothetical protein